ncbi:MAG: hypothetical protein BEN18_00540 [Epulopiscium sp. Nuni2H_MBin001]|nr:MAG: hypothetical protein BEN18_00540 [Epulopiscium sp. Nuni2H_MBin001]
MVINNNLMASNANRFFGINSSGQASSMEKLSSGMRINRAGDDAAGLAISEKMRNQIKGLGQASRNAQDGISLIQTAEGALGESHEMLQRMRELSIQSLNDTYTASDREKIDLEVQALLDEIDSIAVKTEFNEQKLLAGEGGIEYSDDELAAQDAAAAATLMSKAAPIQSRIADANIGVGGSAGESADLIKYRLEIDEDQYSDDAYIEQAIDALIQDRMAYDTTDGIGAAWSDVNGFLTEMEDAQWDDFKALEDDYASMSLQEKMAFYDENKILLDDGTSTFAYTGDNTGTTAYEYLAIEDAGAVELYDELASELEPSRFDESLTGSRVFSFHVGANQNQKIEIDIVAMGAIELGLSEVDVKSKETASAALESIDAAIEEISRQRAVLGAAQNRLEHTIKNVDNTAENLQSAESNIRDTDMAEEMVELTKYNILSQASQAMLAQANQAPQQVLQLLG